MVIRGTQVMPIETRTVLTCGQCGQDKAEANGWFLIFASNKAISIRKANENEKVDQCKGAEAACGSGCVIKLVSKALGGLKHQEVPTGEWKRKR
jgi:hypothetical protein